MNQVTKDVVTKMRNNIIKKSIGWGIVSSVTLLLVYFVIVSLISGIGFTSNQLSQYWYFILSLAFGFGIQMTLYVYLRGLIQNYALYDLSTSKTVAITGTTSTLSMISCCAHYVANIVPLIGVSSVLSLIGQYQIELFWIGIVFNFFGIIYIIRQINKFKKQI